jgi:hypothetical protein
VIFLCTKFHQNLPKSLGGLGEDNLFFKEKVIGPGIVTPLKIITQGSLTICTYIQCDLCTKFHQNPPNGLGGVAEIK